MARSNLNWLVAAMTMALALGLTGGCMGRHPLIKKSSVEFIHPGMTTKAEVTDSLGEPSRVLGEERVYVYEWEEGAQGRGINGAYYRRDVYTPKGYTIVHHLWSFCVAFDEAGHVTKQAFLDAPDSESLNAEIVKWLKTPGK